MAFVMFLFFGTIFWFVCAADSNKLDNQAKKYYANYTEYRHQEEYLLAFEIWMEYKDDLEREDPMKDAEIEAAKRMYDAGYMPYHSGGRTYYARNYQGTQTRHSIDHTYPKRSELLSMRQADEKHPYGVLHQMGPSNDTAEQQKRRAAYNKEIDLRWGELIEKIAYDEYVNRRRWPLTVAEEYMYSCRCAPPKPPDPLAPTPETLRQIVRPDPLSAYRLEYQYHPVHTERMLTHGRPSSLKPALLQDEADCSKDYVFDSEFDESKLEELLQKDKEDWVVLGRSDQWPIYEKFIRMLVELKQMYPTKQPPRSYQRGRTEFQDLHYMTPSQFKSKDRNAELDELIYNLDNIFSRKPYANPYRQGTKQPWDDDFLYELYADLVYRISKSVRYSGASRYPHRYSW